MGELYRKQEEYGQAERMLQRALTICEHHLGPDHLWTATCLRRLASVYQERGKNARAEALLRHALAIYQQHLEADHPWIAACLADLGKITRGRDETEQK